MPDQNPAPAAPLVAKSGGCLRRILIAMGVLVILIVLGPALILWRAENVISERRPRWVADVTAERARCAALRRPVLRGTPLDENAADREKAILEALKSFEQGSIPKLDDIVLGKPLTPALTAVLEKDRVQVAALREALRCTRCDWHYEYEKGPSAPIPSLTGARAVALLTVLEAYERAAAGDTRGAAERCVDLVRFARDLRSSGVYIISVIGSTVETMALHVLTKLAVTDLPGPFPYSETAADLAKLDAAEPSPGEAAARSINSERLSMFAYGIMPRAEAGSDQDGTPLDRRLFGIWLPGYDDALASIAKAQAIDSKTERDAAMEAIRQRIEGTWNVFVRVMPSFAGARLDELLAHRVILETVLAIEQKKTDAGYPKDATGLDLPADPLAASARLHYEGRPDGKGYKLSSVGPDPSNPPPPGSPNRFLVERGPG
jgi:hypothetical protein